MKRSLCLLTISLALYSFSMHGVKSILTKDEATQATQLRITRLIKGTEINKNLKDIKTMCEKHLDTIPAKTINSWRNQLLDKQKTLDDTVMPHVEEIILLSKKKESANLYGKICAYFGIGGFWLAYGTGSYCIQPQMCSAETQILSYSVSLLTAFTGFTSSKYLLKKFKKIDRKQDTIQEQIDFNKEHEKKIVTAIGYFDELLKQRNNLIVTQSYIRGLLERNKTQKIHVKKNKTLLKNLNPNYFA